MFNSLQFLLPFKFVNSLSILRFVMRSLQAEIKQEQEGSSIFATVERVESKLVQVVENTFRDATFKKHQRTSILSLLFFDLSQKIEQEYKSTFVFLYLTSFIHTIGSLIVSSNASNSRKTGCIPSSPPSSFLYYYELIADYYERHPEAASHSLHTICKELVANTLFPSLFALIFYKWVRITIFL